MISEIDTDNVRVSVKSFFFVSFLSCCKHNNHFSCFALLQDGRIDYNEFATMMRKGNVGVGNRSIRGNLNSNLAQALGSGNY